MSASLIITMHSHAIITATEKIFFVCVYSRLTYRYTALNNYDTGMKYQLRFATTYACVWYNIICNVPELWP